MTTPNPTAGVQAVADAYDTITHLGGLEHIRKRSAMYSGAMTTNEYDSALMNIFREPIANSFDEFMNGHATYIRVFFDQRTNLIRIEDDGRGIPFGMTQIKDEFDATRMIDIDKLELAVGIKDSGGKYDKGDAKSFKFSLGMNGVGLKATNALSSSFKVTSNRQGQEATIRYAYGAKTQDVTVTSTLADGMVWDNLSDKEKEAWGKHGTVVEYIADRTLLPFTYEVAHLKRYLHEVAFLNAGLKVELAVRYANEDTDVFEFLEPKGTVAFADHLLPKDKSKVISLPPLTAKDENGNTYEIVFRILEGSGETIQPFVNCSLIEQASTPVARVRQAYAQAMAAVIKDHPKPKKYEKLEIKPEDIRSGLLAVVKFMHQDPQFDSQTKTKMVNTDLSSFISATLPNQIRAFMLTNPDATQFVFNQAVRQAEARLAAQKAREQVLNAGKTKKTQELNVSLDIYTPPLTHDPSRNRLYMFEGGSASGALIYAAKAIDPSTGKMFKHHVGVLALQGVVLNTLEQTLHRAMLNKELATLIQVGGLNPAQQDDTSGLNFNEFIVATDHDMGGDHIATLLFSFFLAHFPAIIEQKRLFRVQTPFFEVTDLKTKEVRFIYAGENKDDAIANMGYDPARVGKDYTLKRNKGLGELSDAGKMTLVQNPRLTPLCPSAEHLDTLRKMYQVFSGSEEVESRRALLFKMGLVQAQEEV